MEKGLPVPLLSIAKHTHLPRLLPNPERIVHSSPGLHRPIEATPAKTPKASDPGSRSQNARMSVVYPAFLARFSGCGTTEHRFRRDRLCRASSPGLLTSGITTGFLVRHSVITRFVIFSRLRNFVSQFQSKCEKCEITAFHGHSLP